MENDKFQTAVTDFQQIASDLNSAYYTEGYDEKYSKKLWKLIKEVEVLPGKIRALLLDSDSK